MPWLANSNVPMPIQTHGNVVFLLFCLRRKSHTNPTHTMKIPITTTQQIWCALFRGWERAQNPEMDSSYISTFHNL